MSADARTASLPLIESDNSASFRNQRADVQKNRRRPDRQS
jgi:hypothetical protein